MKEKVSSCIFWRSGYHSYHSVVKRNILITMLSAAVSTVDREKSLTDWKRELNCPVLPNYILKIS